MLKTSGYALGLQYFPRDLANVNEWKIMFDHYVPILYQLSSASSTYLLSDQEANVENDTVGKQGQSATNKPQPEQQVFEPHHEKTSILHMRIQRRRSASQ